MSAGATISFPKNQPIRFNPPELNCLCDEGNEPTVFFDNTDAPQFQTIVNPCTGAVNIVPNGNFTTAASWGLIGNIAIVDGFLVKSVGNTGFASQANVFQIDTLYQLHIKVDTLINGTIGIFNVFEQASIYEITTPGIYVFNFYATDPRLGIYIPQADAEASIDYVLAYKLPSLGYFWSTAEGQQLPTVYFTSDNTVWKGRVATVTLSLNELSNACLYLNVVTTCDNVGTEGLTNCDFGQDGVGWSFDDNGGNIDYDFGNGFNVTNNGGAPITVSLVNDQVLPIGSYTIVGLHNNGADSIAPILPATSFSTVDITATTITITMTTTAPGQVGLDLTLDPADVFQLEVLCVTSTTTQTPSYHQSQLIKTADYSHSCSVQKVQLYNDEDGLGFVFSGSGFRPFLRVNESRLVNASYPAERDVNELNDGTRTIQYSERRKAKHFKFSLIDEFTIDFLSLMAHADHVLINGEEYFSEDDEIGLSYPSDLENWATGSILMSELVALININSGDRSAIFLPPE